VRRPDAHLSAAEIEALLSSLSSDLEDPAEALQHLATCDVCQAAMDMHREEQNRLARLRTGARAAIGPECPPDIEWLRMAAGLVEEVDASALVRHAAACDHCGLMLRTTVADFADELTLDEEASLSNLDSGRPGWQRRLASQICDTPRRRMRWTFGSFPAWAYGGAAAALALVTIIGGRSLLQTPLETLIATAYTQERTLELRIPNAGYGPVRRTRGGSGSRLDRPAALLEGEARIARELQQHPASPALLQAMGRTDLLDWNYPDAIRSFKQALDLAPRTPGLRTDLASAYFESGEANQHRTSDYAAAIDLLDQALKSTPDDPVALFNRAILYERMDLRNKAIEDWRHYLRVDGNSEWASEAKTRLSKLER
jgi:hypothetical protein